MKKTVYEKETRECPQKLLVGQSSSLEKPVESEVNCESAFRAWGFAKSGQECHGVTMLCCRLFSTEWGKRPTRAVVLPCRRKGVNK